MNWVTQREKARRPNGRRTYQIKTTDAALLLTCKIQGDLKAMMDIHVVVPWECNAYDFAAFMPRGKMTE
jgi:hypothetical protein